MNKPTLVILAAGMGSRYGGLKQIDPIGPHGEIIIDYSLYDAHRAGFERVVFIIKHAIEEEFKEVIGNRISKYMEVEYVFQEADTYIPEWFSIPETRKKPWGTGHALLCCSGKLNGPFAIINADDYYGASAYQVLYDRLVKTQDTPDKYDFCMVGFQLDNTLTDHGTVARGVCATKDGFLTDIVERTKIGRIEGAPAYTEDDGKTWNILAADTPVSMNMWGFTPAILDEIASRFPEFLLKEVPANPEKAEFFIPMEVGRVLQAGKCSVEVLSSPDRWYGVTYKEDKPSVMAALKELTDNGMYPDEKLFA